MNIFSQEALKNEHTLISGATGGIGYETAKEVVRAGGHITITGRNEEKLTSLKKECATINGEVQICVKVADLNEKSSQRRVVQDAEQTIGPVTGLVNSAGITGGGPLEDLREEDLRKVMEFNYFSTVLFTQEVYKSMKSQGRGSIVNLSSLSGLRGTHGGTAYSASKFAIIGFTQSFAHEAIEHGVRVNAVCPGYVDTTMGRESIRSKGEREGRTYEKQRKVAEKGIPSGKLSEPSEVARTIVYLLTEASTNIVGESLKISGGSVMR
ncbi:3-oxoacyl-[acyl-carrier protein] reductase [Halobacillus karajensis]|uniref:Ketoacyl reductase n=1 Tax=Halobacillus karajensis TaxID=195088 RepID=A0A024P993_9BACI|nr:SDR family oxidoreductase [Halobacillus karajensis]CDQ21488.1 Putative ketoacyl reductase [Halobacillus karajensis]CDQ25423.1 Putative ketoacyl reductase [Halobacillus karajensis]CDQ29747.1 Putative ketoacyl reductase [Halobacillus karajensis]SEI08193.1 3-oxoacyl-[acyl-carrier protein] reductase [Halobacillus karajensis]